MKNKKEINIYLNDNIIKKNKEKNYYYIIDKYISFIKSKLNINNYELTYILSLTLSNKYNKIFDSNKDYNNNIYYYESYFKKMFMFQYEYNLNYLNIDQLDFDNFIKLLNFRKKRLYVYFEKINKQNKSLFLHIINYLN